MFKNIILGFVVLLAASTCFSSSGRNEKDPLSATCTLWSCLVSQQLNQTEKFAVTDYQRYISQVTGVIPQIMTHKQWDQKTCPAVIICKPNTGFLKNTDIDWSRIGAQGYCLKQLTLKNRMCLLIAAKTDIGIVNGVYGLLKEIGFGFYLGSEAIPESLPKSPALTETYKNPAFRIRGVLPWYNFFNSPTIWEPVDHRAFVDQLVRMGANFIGFHTYDIEPFAAIEENGVMLHGHRLLNTASSTWGTHPTPTGEFAFGVDKLFADDYFGAETTRLKNPNEAIKAEQDILRDALQYAKDRGMHTCMGFEMAGNPLDQKTRDIFLRRLNHVLDQYSAIDYIWLWQPEMMGATGFMPKSPKDPLMNYSLARRDVFKRAVKREPGWGAEPYFQNNARGNQARANEGARLEQFAMLALHALRHRQDAPTLVLSGWGGDQRLLSAEYYDGLDKLLPSDVVFSSLDTIKGWQGGHVPFRQRVDLAYHDLPDQRQRWPIIWLEGDGDLWHPQPGVYKYCQGVARDIHQSGSQGFLAIHWRTREAETCYAYMMQYAWDPGLTADDFFQDLAHRCYGPVAKEMTPVLIGLDKLFYRWVGGEGQAECGEFRWDAGQQELVDQLIELRKQVATIMPKAGSAIERMEWLLHRIDWVLTFRRVQAKAIQANHLLVKAHGAEKEQAAAYAKEVLELLNGEDFAQALRHYSQRVSTRGEYGVLATINTKALYDWRKLRSEAQAILQVTEPEPHGTWQAQADVIVPRFYGSVEQGDSFVFEAIVLGDRKAFLHLRSPGTNQWNTLPLKTEKGWVQSTVIGLEFITPPALEVAVSFSENCSDKPAWGPTTITVMPRLKTPSKLAKKPLESAPEPIKAVLSESKDFIFKLHWDPVWQADYYQVLRDGKRMVETAVTEFFDNPPHPSGNYIVKAFRYGDLLAQSAPVDYKLPNVKITEVPELTAVSRYAGVLLKWPQTKSPYVAVYEIDRRLQGSEDWDNVAVISASRNSENRFFDVADAGHYTYRIVAVSGTGIQSDPVEVTALVPSQPALPVIDLPLTEPPADLKVVGKVDFTPEGAHFKDGYFDIPFNEKLLVTKGLTVECELSFDTTDGMQVPLCHGWSSAEGWFVQLLGHKITLCTPAVNQATPVIETNHWHQIRWVFDGSRAHLFMDGNCIHTTEQPVSMTDCTKDIRVGHYRYPAPSYAFDGKMRNLKIYDDVILD